MNKIHKILLLLATIVFLQSCEEPILKDKQVERTVKIAVVLSDDSYDRWERIMNLVQNNIREATDIYPVFEFYNEDSHDMMNLAYDLAKDESISCVIGCESEENTEILAYQMSRLKKPKPMFTFNTSQEVIRKYSRMGFMWGFSESDITQSEVLLAQIAADLSNREVALIASNTSYGQTFVDWFAFQATELGLTPLKICTYDKTSEIAPIMKELSSFNCPIVCVPNSHVEAAEMIKNTHNGYFSHKAFNDKTLEILRKSDTKNEFLMHLYNTKDLEKLEHLLDEVLDFLDMQYAEISGFLVVIFKDRAGNYKTYMPLVYTKSIELCHHTASQNSLNSREISVRC